MSSMGGLIEVNGIDRAEAPGGPTYPVDQQKRDWEYVASEEFLLGQRTGQEDVIAIIRSELSGGETSGRSKIEYGARVEFLKELLPLVNSVLALKDDVFNTESPNSNSVNS